MNRIVMNTTDLKILKSAGFKYLEWKDDCNEDCTTMEVMMRFFKRNKLSSEKIIRGIIRC